MEVEPIKIITIDCESLSVLGFLLFYQTWWKVIKNICSGIVLQKFYGTCTLLEYFYFLLLYTYTLLLLRGNYFVLYYMYLEDLVTSQIQINETENN